MRGAALLRDWLASQRMTVAGFARVLGVTDESLHHYFAGRRVPNLKSALAIQDATGGSVPASSWLETSTEA